MTLSRLILVAALLASSAAHAAPELDLLTADLDGTPVALDVDGDGHLVLATVDARRTTLVRLDELGARVGRPHRLASEALDLAVDRRTGHVVVLAADGLTAFDPTFAPLWHHPLVSGPAAKISVGELGTVVALSAETLHIFDDSGRARAAVHAGVDDPRDLAVFDAADLVAVTGANHGACDTTIDSLALAGVGLDGAPRWQAHGDAAECDTAARGVAVTRGDDSLLYVLAEVDGSLPTYLRSRAHVVIDGYTDPETSSPAQAAYYARFTADGAHQLGQMFALPDEGAVVRPAQISADEHGNVFLTGTTSHSLGAADERAVTAALDAPAGFYQVVSPDFETRRVWRPIEADGLTTKLGQISLAGDRVFTLLTAAPTLDAADADAAQHSLPIGPTILVWPSDHGPVTAEKRPNPDTQGTFGYESGVSGSDPTCYCEATALPGPAALLSLGVLTLAALPRPRRRRR